MASPGQFVPEYIVTANDMNALPGGVLGYAERTTSQTGIGGTDTDLTGLSVTVDVVAGRRIRITSHCDISVSAADNGGLILVKESTTTLGRTGHGYVPLNGASFQATGSVVLTPSSGSHTYKLTGRRVGSTGTISLTAASDNPAFILVEDIGPA